MARKKKELPLLEDIEITGVAAEGKSLAKIKLKTDDENPCVVFIPYGAPGDIADIKIDKKKHNFCEGHIVKLKKSSPIRCKPECEHFGLCGGCKWQHLPYSSQLDYKRQQVVDAMQRIAKIEMPEIRNTLPSHDIWRYRNKMEYTFSNKKWRSWDEIRENKEFTDSHNALGFHIPGAFDKVLHISNCHLQDKIGDEIRNYIYSHAESKGYTFFDIKENKGLLRTLMIRTASTGQTMACLSFGEDNKEAITDILTSIKEHFTYLTSILYVINKKLNDSIADQEIHQFSGPEFIEEEMEGLRFRINAKSFYQTNSRQAYELYKVARDFAGIKTDNTSGNLPLVYDLYTGAGTIANFLAHGAAKVIGIEYVEEAIEDAKLNSRVNGIDNTLFFAGDMKDVLTDEFIKTHGKPDIMIVDPPRAGMHENVVKVILNAAPPVIVYVSCNPATQARDLALLDEKYKVTDVQPVDMFPHTHHIENVVRLELK